MRFLINPEPYQSRGRSQAVPALRRPEHPFLAWFMAPAPNRLFSVPTWTALNCSLKLRLLGVLVTINTMVRKEPTVPLSRNENSKTTFQTSPTGNTVLKLPGVFAFILYLVVDSNLRPLSFGCRHFLVRPQGQWSETTKQQFSPHLGGHCGIYFTESLTRQHQEMVTHNTKKNSAMNTLGSWEVRSF